MAGLTETGQPLGGNPSFYMLCLRRRPVFRRKPHNGDSGLKPAGYLANVGSIFGIALDLIDKLDYQRH
jgi:hypothetical protein